MSVQNMETLSIKKASVITAISKYINIFLGIFFSAILARILTPNDYGIVAIVSVFTSFFIVLSNCGLGIAVIQRKDFNNDDINSLFTFSFYLGLVLSSIFILLAYPISLFYKDKVYIPICCLLSISIFFNTINAIPDGLLRKNKKFFLIALRLIVVSIVTYGLTIVFALLNFNYYSLVIQSILSGLLVFIWNLKNVKLRLVKKVNWSVLKSIFEYSGYNFLFNFFNYFSRNLDKIIIGKALGNEELAQYNKAYHFMLYPVQNLTNIITPTLHPILSEFQNDVIIIYEKYIRIIKLLSLVGVFVTAVCFINSKEIITIMYGNQWTSAITCFKFMSLAIWSQMIGGTTGAVFAALNDTKSHFYITIVNFITILLGIFIGNIFRSIDIISLCVSIVLNLHFFTNFPTLIKKTMQLSYINFLKKLSPDILILILLLILIIPLSHLSITNIFLSLLIKSSIIALVFIVLITLLKQWSYFLPICPGKLKSFLEKSISNKTNCSRD